MSYPTCAIIETVFTVVDHCITSPGPFKGAARFTPYYAHKFIQNPTMVVVRTSDVTQFPELEDVHWVRLTKVNDVFNAVPVPG